MLQLRSVLLAMSLAVATMACTQVAPEDLVIPSSSTVGAGVDAAPTSAPTTTLPAIAPLAELPGSIAISGTPDLGILLPTGEEVWAAPADTLFSQPAWSRDGTRSIFFNYDPLVAGSGQIYSVDAESGIWTTTEARRPYFFFSPSYGGDFFAALGPGASGTTLDILDSTGQPASDQSLHAGSFYLAWEPDGNDLLLHRDATLELARDPLDLENLEPLGEPGQLFLAPSWIPGTREALIATANTAGNRLIRINVDTGVDVDLGPISGTVGLVMAPDGSRVLVAHGAAGGADLAIVNRRVQAVTGATEIIDLSTGARELVSPEPVFWAEWSRDGSRLALLQAAEDGTAGMEWVIWEDGAAMGLGTFLPSPSFFRNYVFFAWQFVESPRVWSPDGQALVYGGLGSDGIPGIYVHRIGAESSDRISDGDVAFWSPL